jgi:Flp pilus assembly protein TadD
MRQGRLDEAIPQFTEALRISPASAEALNDLAVALGSAGRYDEAVARLEEALRLDPDSEESRRNLATAKEAKRRAGGR